MEVRDVVKDQLKQEGAKPLSAEEKEAAKQLFEKYDSDNNGTVDNNELRMLLKTEFKVKDGDVDGVMAKFDSNKDGKIDFDEFCRLCQFNRNALVMGLAMDMLTAANFAKWGCYCCLCTVCFSWCPYYCKVKQIERRILTNEYQRTALKSDEAAPAAQPAAAQPAPADPKMDRV